MGRKQIIITAVVVFDIYTTCHSGLIPNYDENGKSIMILIKTP